MSKVKIPVSPQLNYINGCKLITYGRLFFAYIGIYIQFRLGRVQKMQISGMVSGIL